MCAAQRFAIRTASSASRHPVVAGCHLSTLAAALLMTMAMAQQNRTAVATSREDLNNVLAMRNTRELPIDYNYVHRSLAICQEEDDSKLQSKYRPFLLDAATTESDWISQLELSTVTKMAEENLKITGERVKVLVLTGSLRKR